MTEYRMPVLSEHVKQRLINFCKADLSNWSPDGDYYPLLRIALAALTAKPVAVTDKAEVVGLSESGWVGSFLAPDFHGIDAGDEVFLYILPPVPVKQEGEQCGKCKGNGWFADEMGMRRCFMCNDLVQEGEHRD